MVAYFKQEIQMHNKIQERGFDASARKAAQIKSAPPWEESYLLNPANSQGRAIMNSWLVPAQMGVREVKLLMVHHPPRPKHTQQERDKERRTHTHRHRHTRHSHRHTET